MQEQFKREWIARTLALMVVAGYAVAVPGLARAQDSSEDASTPADEEITPLDIAEFRTLDYKIRPKKLWKAIISELEERGFPPEEVDKKARIVKTSFVDFESKDFGGQVVEPRLSFGSNRHILSKNKIRMGKVSLEIRVAKSDAGTKMKVRARILVDGMDRRKMIRVLVDRRSSGIIEADFIERLETTLGIEPI
ncbi:MAG: hypothetical protein V3U83_00905 [Acidobacteriota bacterium]